MLRVNAPIKMPTTWGSGAKPGYIRTIGSPSLIGKTDGAASYTDGFPPLNFTPVAAGGVPPYGADMNGILNQVTQWEQWAQVGGPIRYDAIFQSAVGGYPAEARVGSNTTTYLIWQSTADNNVTNPDTGTTVNWQTPVFPDVSNATKMNPGLTITGASTLGANLAFVGNGTVAPRKWLRVWNGNLSVMNNANLNEIFTLNDAGDLSNLRNITAAGNVSTLNLSVSGSTTTGDITASGDVTSSGKLTGASLAVTGAATVGTSLTVGGATTLNNTLTVASATTLKTTLTVTGATTLSGALSVTGATALSSTLAVTGAATLSNNLTVTGTTQTGALTVVNNGSIGKDFFIGATGWMFHWEDETYTVDAGHPDGKAHHKYTQYNGNYGPTTVRGYWYDRWNGGSGDREWYGPRFLTNPPVLYPADVYVGMRLHIGYQPEVTYGDIYLAVYGDLHLGRDDNWIFEERRVPFAGSASGYAYHKYTFLNGLSPLGYYWYDLWNGFNGDREWHAPIFDTNNNPIGDRTLMTLKGAKTLNLSFLNVNANLMAQGDLVIGASEMGSTAATESYVLGVNQDITRARVINFTGPLPGGNNPYGIRFNRYDAQGNELNLLSYNRGGDGAEMMVVTNSGALGVQNVLSIQNGCTAAFFGGIDTLVGNNWMGALRFCGVATNPNMFSQFGYRNSISELTYNTKVKPTGGGAWACFDWGDTVSAGTCSATGFPVISDATLKTNATPFLAGLREIMNLSPITYQFAEGAEFGRPDDIYHGVNAQDVQKVLPEAVTAMTRYTDGNDSIEVLTVDIATVLYAAVNAIKELAVRVGALDGGGDRADASA
jgi:hypothetical protein